MSICGACKTGELGRHCPETNTTCRWTKCRNRDCLAIYDVPNLRGFVVANGATTVLRL